MQLDFAHAQAEFGGLVVSDECDVISADYDVASAEFDVASAEFDAASAECGVVGETAEESEADMQLACSVVGQVDIRAAAGRTEHYIRCSFDPHWHPHWLHCGID